MAKDLSIFSECEDGTDAIFSIWHHQNGSSLANSQLGLGISDFGGVSRVSIVVYMHTLYESMLSCVQLVSIFIIFRDIWELLRQVNRCSRGGQWRRSQQGQDGSWELVLDSLGHDLSYRGHGLRVKGGVYRRGSHNWHRRRGRCG